MIVVLMVVACLLTCLLVELVADDCPCEHLPEFEDLTEEINR